MANQIVLVVLVAAPLIKSFVTVCGDSLKKISDSNTDLSISRVSQPRE